MLTRKEISRQIMHLALGLGMAVAYYYDILSSFAVFLGIIAGGLISFLCKRTRLPIFSFFLDCFEREEQKHQFPGRGTIFYFVGVLLAMQLFPKDIALASIMVLAFGDSVSHLFGERFGKMKNIFNGYSPKLLEGTLAGTVTGFFGAVFFVPVPEAFFGSLLAMIAEVVEIDLNGRPLDDNLIVPLVAGTAMLLLRHFL